MQLATELLLGALVVGLVLVEVYDYQPPVWFFWGLALIAAAAAVATASLPAAVVCSVMAVLLARGAWRLRAGLRRR